VYLLSDYIPATPYTVYLASVEMRQSSVVSTGDIKIVAYDSSKSLISNTTVASKTLPTTLWLTLGGAYTAPANTAYIRVLLQRNTAGANVYIDNARLEVGSPMFSAKVSSDITLTGVTKIIVFDTEIADRGDWYNHTNGKATAPVSGDYLIRASVPCFRTANNDQVNVDFYVNGVLAYRFGFLDTQHHGSAEQAIKSILDLTYPLESGDTFHIQVEEATSTGFKGSQFVRAIGATFSAKLLR